MTKRSTQNTDLSAERLRSFLQYNKDTGNFYWLVNRRVKAGDIAGTPNYSGHIRIRIDGPKYMAHQLAWLYFATYTTQTEANIFCRICGRAVCHRAGPGQYQIWLHL